MSREQDITAITRLRVATASALTDLEALGQSAFVTHRGASHAAMVRVGRVAALIGELQLTHAALVRSNPQVSWTAISLLNHGITSRVSAERETLWEALLLTLPALHHDLGSVLQVLLLER